MNAIQLALSLTLIPSPSLSSSPLSTDFLPYSVYEPSADGPMGVFTGYGEYSDLERDRDQLPYSPYDPADDDEDEYPEDDEDGYTDAEADSATLRDAGMGMDEGYGYYGTASYDAWN